MEPTEPPFLAQQLHDQNQQVNYWPAAMSNLTEMNEPLIAHIAHMEKIGAATAHDYYRMRGWVVHHNSDLWAQTNPVGAGTRGSEIGQLGGAGQAQHLDDQYCFTGDKAYLQLMRGAADFSLDWLTEQHGQLLIAPSTSLENLYLHPSAFQASVTIESAMDMEIIWDLFTNLIEVSKIIK